MTTKTVYQCTADGVFIGETLVQEDVFAAGTYLMPPHCTHIAPPAFDAATQQAVRTDDVWTVRPLPTRPLAEAPELRPVATEDNKPHAGKNEIPVIVDGQWQLIADYRGTVYWLPDGTEHRILAIGEEMPRDAMASPPAASDPAVPT